MIDIENPFAHLFDLLSSALIPHKPYNPLNSIRHALFIDYQSNIKLL